VVWAWEAEETPKPNEVFLLMLDWLHQGRPLQHKDWALQNWVANVDQLNPLWQRAARRVAALHCCDMELMNV
jgi:hypothetical protein